MNKEKLNIPELRIKILKGLDLSFQKLVLKKQRENGDFVFSENGKIVTIKAKDLIIEKRLKE